GLVGGGSRGICITNLFKGHPACDVTAIMDHFPACAEKAAGALGLPATACHTRWDRFLRDAPVDALFLACDPRDQARMACEAMRKGKHVCTEVPAAFTIEDLWALVRAQEKTGCVYQLMEQTRYWGFVDAWKKLKDRGELGHVCLAQGEYVHYERNWGHWVDQRTGEVLGVIPRPRNRRVKPTWRRELLRDPIYYLPHTLSPLLKILGTRVEQVACMGTRPASYTPDQAGLPWRDIEYAVMHTAGDTVLLVGAGFSLPHVKRGPLHAHWYELRGTNGSVTSPRYPDDRFRQWTTKDETYAPVKWSETPLDADARQAKTGHGGADFKPVDTFIRSILKGNRAPVDAVLAAEITAPAILAVESARRGGAMLKVPDFRK
ncbi:MAG: Gfo/Idh/MocA family oxidoreductase, partial [Lentisphaerae bacterium]|nr:Gfo/Idh/MocA family oxidoreductase [Lentisphaerota bacterium]